MKKIEELFPKFNEIPNNHKLEFPIIQKEYLIDGEILQWNGEMKKVYSPIYIKERDNFNNYIGEIPNMREKESQLAFDAAFRSYNQGNGVWAKMKNDDRIECLLKFTSLIKEKREKIVSLLIWEIGKSEKDSEKEFDRTISYIYDTIDALKNLDRTSSRFVVSNDIVAQIRRAPLGVTLCMGPFNYPLNETFTTLIPSLIMGNSLIIKPPKLGVLIYRELLEAFRDSFPKGTVNIIYGSGEKIVTPIMKNENLNVLAFIGSSKVANILKKEHPRPNRLKTVLGLDAKNPAIILKDANITETVNECLLGSLSYNGQRCTAIKIIFAHEDIADKFTKNFAEAVNNIKIGLPWEEKVTITPLAEMNKGKKLNALIEDACKKGAKLENPNGGKYFLSMMKPAVLSNVTKDMDIFNVEQFGPVVPIVKYKNISEVLNYVIESNYGQQASIFGNNSDEIATLIDTLVNQVCRVNINSQCQRGPDEFPFTGRKDSAEQTLSISDSLRVFSIRTLVAAKETKENTKIIKDILKENKSNFLNTDFIL